MTWVDQIRVLVFELNWISIPIISHCGVACYLDKAHLNFDHYLHLLFQYRWLLCQQNHFVTPPWTWALFDSVHSTITTCPNKITRFPKTNKEDEFTKLKSNSNILRKKIPSHDLSILFCGIIPYNIWANLQTVSLHAVSLFLIRWKPSNTQSWVCRSSTLISQLDLWLWSPPISVVVDLWVWSWKVPSFLWLVVLGCAKRTEN